MKKQVQVQAMPNDVKKQHAGTRVSGHGMVLVSVKPQTFLL